MKAPLIKAGLPGHRPLKLDPFAYAVWRRSEGQRPQAGRWLLACSGGMDSSVLAYAAAMLAERWGVELAIGHVHHGFSDTNQNQAREQMQRAVEQLAARLKLPLLVRQVSARGLASEAELRKARHQALADIQKEWGGQCVLMAHHHEDQLETRLIQMIRGTGTLKGMSIVQEFQRPTLEIYRPFLSFSRSELLKFAQRQAVEWYEDPSNEDPSYLRNWLRCQWLPQLESRQNGACQALARSLELIANASSQESAGQDPGTQELGTESCAQKLDFLLRGEFQSRAKFEQGKMIRNLIRGKGLNTMTKGQIDEVIKRLDSPRIRLRFQVAGLVWDVSREKIEVSEKAPPAEE